MHGKINAEKMQTHLNDSKALMHWSKWVFIDYSIEYIKRQEKKHENWH